MSFFTRKWQFLPCLYHLSSAPFIKRYMHWAMLWTLSIRRFLLATLKNRTYMSLSMPYSRAFMHRYRLYDVLTHRSVQIPARSEVSRETNHWTSDSHHHCEHGCSANISVILSQILWIILTGINQVWGMTPKRTRRMMFGGINDDISMQNWKSIWMSTRHYHFPKSKKQRAHQASHSDSGVCQWLDCIIHQVTAAGCLCKFYGDDDDNSSAIRCNSISDNCCFFSVCIGRWGRLAAALIWLCSAEAHSSLLPSWQLKAGSTIFTWKILKSMVARVMLLHVWT